MKLQQLTEEWSKEQERRAREWTSRQFNAVGPPNGPWHVVDRLALRDETVAGPFDDYDEAWAEADRLQALANKKEVEYYKKGGRGMMPGLAKGMMGR